MPTYFFFPPFLVSTHKLNRAKAPISTVLSHRCRDPRAALMVAVLNAVAACALDDDDAALAVADAELATLDVAVPCTQLQFWFT
jgi:hypothetical protein